MSAKLGYVSMECASKLNAKTYKQDSVIVFLELYQIIFVLN